MSSYQRNNRSGHRWSQVNLPISWVGRLDQLRQWVFFKLYFANDFASWELKKNGHIQECRAEIASCALKVPSHPVWPLALSSVQPLGSVTQRSSDLLLMWLHKAETNQKHKYHKGARLNRAKKTVCGLKIPPAMMWLRSHNETRLTDLIKRFLHHRGNQKNLLQLHSTTLVCFKAAAHWKEKFSQPLFTPQWFRHPYCHQCSPTSSLVPTLKPVAWW